MILKKEYGMLKMVMIILSVSVFLLGKEPITI